MAYGKGPVPTRGAAYAPVATDSCSQIIHPRPARRAFPELDCVRDRLPLKVVAAVERRAIATGVGADRVLIAAGIIEISIPHFGVVFASLAAAVAAIAAVLGFGLAVQISVFSVALVFSLLVLRPRFLGRFTAPGVPSRVELLVGKSGMVTLDIDPLLGTGRLTVDGQDWAARSAEAIPAGVKVVFVGADGIVLEVRRA